MSIVERNIYSWVPLNSRDATSAVKLWFPGMWAASKYTPFWISNSYYITRHRLHSSLLINIGYCGTSHFSYMLQVMSHTAQKMKFSIKNFFSKFDQLRRKLWIWSHLLKKSLMEKFIFCAVSKERKISYQNF